MNLRQILLILRLRWWVVVGTLLAAAGLALGVSLLMPKQYTAETALLLDRPIDPLMATLAPNFTNPAFMATQIEIIQSERVAGQVVKMLGLANNAKAVEQWRQETEGRVPLETYFGTLLQRGLKVEPGRGSSLLTISFTGSDPKFAAAGANTFARAYFEVTSVLNPTREYAKFFDERIKLLRSELESSQERLSSFQQKRGIVVTNERMNLEDTRLTSLEAALAAAQTEQADASSRTIDTSDTSAAVLASGAVQTLKGELGRAQAQLIEVSAKFGASHPQRIELEARVAELRQQLSVEVRRVSGGTNSVSRVAGQKLTELRNLVENQKKLVLNLRSQRDEASVLLRDVDTAQRAYDAVAQRRTQLANEAQADQTSARVLSPATEPLRPSKPNLVEELDGGRDPGPARRRRPGLPARIHRPPRAQRRRSDGLWRRAGAGRDVQHPGSSAFRTAPGTKPSPRLAGAAAHLRRGLTMTPVTMLSTKVRNADRSIGAILIDAGRLTAQDAERIINFQKQTDLRFGEAGIELGLISEGDVLYALSLQFDYPYLQPGPNKPISPEVVAAYKPFSAEGEGLRALRSQLQLRWFDAKGANTSLAIVGASRGEGRSYLAANLAVTFAQLGERTLLIDADMRTPRQHKLFKIENQTGLSNLLAGRMQDQVVTFVHGIPGLAVLPSGPTPPNPGELLSRPALPRILQQSMSTFDVVLIDTPAIEQGPDALLLARGAGASLMVARTNLTRTAQFDDAVAAMAESNVFIVGSVLVDVAARRNASQAAES